MRLVMNCPTPHAMTSAIASTWLRNRIRSRTSFRSRQDSHSMVHVLSPFDFGWGRFDGIRADLYDLPAVHPDHAVCHGRDGRVVRDDRSCRPQLAVDPSQHLEN